MELSREARSDDEILYKPPEAIGTNRDSKKSLEGESLVCMNFKSVGYDNPVGDKVQCHERSAAASGHVPKNQHTCTSKQPEPR